MTDGLSVPSVLQIITTTLPLIAIVFVFIQDRVVFPYSEVTAVPINCSEDAVTLGLSNVGNRPAIVAGGRLAQIPMAVPPIVRDLSAAADRSMVLEPGKTDVRSFGITTLNGVEVGPVSSVESGKQCFYRITLATLEFGVDSRPPKIVTCQCPSAQ